jgi:copper(I)-binding protein
MRTRRHTLGRATIGLVAVTLAAVGLVACGDDGDDSAGDTTTTEAPKVDVTVKDVWARPVEDLTAKDTSAIYMVITAGEEGDSLVKASVPSDVAGTVELHETVAAEEGDAMEGESMEGDAMESTTTAMSGDMESTTTAMSGDMGDDAGDDMSGMMTMKPVTSIEIPAGETVELKPGGYHVMLLDVKKVLAVGDTIEVTLTFENAGEVTTTAEVREP